ncbi:hypothetical protein MPTK1_7g17420 [Marchantia polymorpha subsp. ruderalis]|uniref:Uncharacterized protein n=2 Tax=Marchantia polymorpha TaxID=3197 RepID=A0AAF6C0R9_MARPO|nr:hypothetical protein MARPO_0051s0079 [Marchantia polymorpha]BBN17853.1 hypothetical protein Mp_7g17420 [Marchantia polymorpha subsp. ruderalis]|eukprot:PTQ38478.1 hypothetical protein MARPO_0051s0079 [Marchantia polymorpha]
MSSHRAIGTERGEGEERRGGAEEQRSGAARGERSRLNAWEAGGRTSSSWEGELGRTKTRERSGERSGRAQWQRLPGRAQCSGRLRSEGARRCGRGAEEGESAEGERQKGGAARGSGGCYRPPDLARACLNRNRDSFVFPRSGLRENLLISHHKSVNTIFLTYEHCTYPPFLHDSIGTSTYHPRTPVTGQAGEVGPGVVLPSFHVECGRPALIGRRRRWDLSTAAIFPRYRFLLPPSRDAPPALASDRF